MTTFTAVVKLLLYHDHAASAALLQLIFRASICAVIFALVEVVKKLGCRALSLRVHSHSLFSTLRVRAHHFLVHCVSYAVLRCYHCSPGTHTTLHLMLRFHAARCRGCSA